MNAEAANEVFPPFRRRQVGLARRIPDLDESLLREGNADARGQFARQKSGLIVAALPFPPARHGHEYHEIADFALRKIHPRQRGSERLREITPVAVLERLNEPAHRRFVRKGAARPVHLGQLVFAFVTIALRDGHRPAAVIADHRVIGQLLFTARTEVFSLGEYFIPAGQTPPVRAEQRAQKAFHTR